MLLFCDSFKGVSLNFSQQLLSGKLIRRYKRFLSDVELEDGQIVTVHTPNSGSMKTCIGEGWPVKISDSKNPKRKLPMTLEMIHNGTCWIGVNTTLANKIAEEAIESGKIKELKGYHDIRREVKYGENSRVDLLLSGKKGLCYVEVKSVTLVEEGVFMFPDSVSVRGTKHIRELMAMVEQGHRAVLLYVIQRSDAKYFRPASHIDPDYARAMKEARDAGVEFLAYRADVSPERVILEEKVRIRI